jgi:hypothetical protein
MAVGIYVALTGMTSEKYSECSKRLKQAGAAHPPGRSYHTAFGPPDKLMVFDVWSSQAAFDKFGKTLLPILQQLGVDPGQPSVAEIHKVVKPPVAHKKKKRAATKVKRRGAKKR